MQCLPDRQRGFAAALLDPIRPIPLGLIGPDGEPSSKRFSVYRNNVIVGLTDALQASFPAVSRIVGEEFFRGMARAYVISEPPTSPILLEYGAGLANFIARFEPASSLPYLPDVARIERAWSEAYHAREAHALEPDALTAVSSDRIAEIRFTFHPSLRVVRSPFPALTIWRMNVDDGVPMPVDLAAGGEDALILRPDGEVELRSMPEGGAAFVTALAEGKPLAEAAQCASSSDTRFDLSINLAALIGAGAFVEIGFAEQC